MCDFVANLGLFWFAEVTVEVAGPKCLRCLRSLGLGVAGMVLGTPLPKFGQCRLVPVVSWWAVACL